MERDKFGPGCTATGSASGQLEVGRDKVRKDQEPDLPNLNATTLASHESLHNPMPSWSTIYTGTLPV